MNKIYIIFEQIIIVLATLCLLVILFIVPFMAYKAEYHKDSTPTSYDCKFECVYRKDASN